MRTRTEPEFRRTEACRCSSLQRRPRGPSPAPAYISWELFRRYKARPGVSMAAALALAVINPCLPDFYFYLPPQRCLDIRLVTGFIAWHHSGLCQAWGGTAAKSCPFVYRDALLFERGHFKFIIAHMLQFIVFGSRAIGRGGALMIRIDYFTTGGASAGLPDWPRAAFRPCW